MNLSSRDLPARLLVLILEEMKAGTCLLLSH